MTHIMLDLEVLGNGTNGLLASIGAVKFNLEKGTLGEEFYVEMSKQGYKQQVAAGRQGFDIDNIVWWMQQSDAARKVFCGTENKYNIYTILEDFHDFCPSNAKVWGNGVDFDNVFIRDLYRDIYKGHADGFKLRCPFSSKNNRCYRTYKGMFGHKAKLERIGTHHNGLDDAKTQAMHLIKMHQAVNK